MSKMIIHQLAEAKRKIIDVANELHAHGIDLMQVRLIRDEDGGIEQCLLTWGMDV